jgi:membrane protein YqaA with SNARE-associated domain
MFQGLGFCPESFATADCKEGSASFMDMYQHILWPILLWGTGTALGESPPFFVAKARKAAIANNLEVDEDDEEDEAEGVIKQMMDWMTDVCDRWGWWGVLAFSAWPNALFDVCGMCCGSSEMSFWTFMSACILGKAGIKACILQGGCFIVAFSTAHREMLSEFGKTIPILGFPIGKLVGFFEGVAKKNAAQLNQKVVAAAAATAEWALPSSLAELQALVLGLLKQAIPFGVLLLILGFLMTTVNEFAQMNQHAQDKKVLQTMQDAADEKAKKKA